MRKKGIFTGVILILIGMVFIAFKLFIGRGGDIKFDQATEMMINERIDDYEYMAYKKDAVVDDETLEQNVNLAKGKGADENIHGGDHDDSSYYKRIDFFDMESTESLTILTHFKTYQQSSDWSCGVASAEMVLEWYGMRENYDEESLAKLRDIGLKPTGTSLRQEMQIFERVGGFDLISTYNYISGKRMTAANKKIINRIFTSEYIIEHLTLGHPIIVGWHCMGAHWQVIIGYDTMNTETINDDVVIVADPYDVDDHSQDGYMIYSARRFLMSFSFNNRFDEAKGDLNYRCFLVPIPESTRIR